MHGLSFTEAVLRLQRDVHTPEQEAKLAPLVLYTGVASVAALRKATSPDECAECALAVWRQLAAMDLSTRDLEFPPPYTTKAVLGIIRSNIPGSGGNKVLHPTRAPPHPLVRRFGVSSRRRCVRVCDRSRPQFHK